MRRPVMYLAGLLLATGATVAMAGPASAAPSHESLKSHSSHGWINNDECDDDYDYWYLRRHHRHHSHGDINQSYNGINLLSGNIFNGGLL